MARKRERFRRKELSSAEYSFRKTVLEATNHNAETYHLGMSMEDCGRWFGNNPFGPYRCNQPLCPDCRHYYKKGRIKTVMTKYAPQPKENILFITLLHDALPLLSDPVTEATIAGASKPQVQPRTFEGLKERLLQFRRDIRAPFDVAGLDGLLIHGSFEFELKVFGNGVSNTDLFIRASLDKQNLAPPEAGNRYFNTHCHLLVCARKDGKFLNARRVRKMLKDRFALPSQPHVQNLRKKQTKQEAIAKCTGYAHKGHIGRTINAAEIRELVLALDALGRTRTGVSLARGDLKPPSKKAIKAKVKALRPKPTSGTRMRDGTRAP